MYKYFDKQSCRIYDYQFCFRDINSMEMIWIFFPRSYYIDSILLWLIVVTISVSVLSSFHLLSTPLYTLIHTRAHTHTHTYTHTQTYTNTDTHIHTQTDTHTHTLLYTPPEHQQNTHSKYIPRCAYVQILTHLHINFSYPLPPIILPM